MASNGAFLVKNYPECGTKRSCRNLRHATIKRNITRCCVNIYQRALKTPRKHSQNGPFCGSDRQNEKRQRPSYSFNCARSVVLFSLPQVTWLFNNTCLPLGTLYTQRGTVIILCNTDTHHGITYFRELYTLSCKAVVITPPSIQRK